MPGDESEYKVDLGGYFMQLRRNELQAVAAGLGTFDSSAEGDLLTLVEALGEMPIGQRAPVWELAVRRFGQHKSLERAAGEIGLDAVRARAMLIALSHAFATVPVPEQLGQA